MGQSLSGLVFQPPMDCWSRFQNNESIFMIGSKSGRSVPSFLIDVGASITVIYSHGNSEIIPMLYDYLNYLTRKLFVNILAYEYNGYYPNSENCSEEGCYSDISIVYDYLIEEKGFSPRQIVLWGVSLGSGPSCYLCEKLSKRGEILGGLILQSSFSSIFRIAGNFRFTLPGDMFPNVDRIRHVNCPVFVIHGTRDEVVPFQNGEELFEAIPKRYKYKPLWVPNGNHNSLESSMIPGYDLPYYVRQFLMDRVSQYRKGKFGVTADVTAVPSYDHNDNLDDEHHPNFISSYERSSII